MSSKDPARYITLRLLVCTVSKVDQAAPLSMSYLHGKKSEWWKPQKPARGVKHCSPATALQGIGSSFLLKKVV
jgi:hypothetical protein